MMKVTPEANEALQNAMAAIDAVYHQFMHETNIDILFNAICNLKASISKLERFREEENQCQS